MYSFEWSAVVACVRPQWALEAIKLSCWVLLLLCAATSLPRAPDATHRHAVTPSANRERPKTLCGPASTLGWTNRTKLIHRQFSFGHSTRFLLCFLDQICNTTRSIHDNSGSYGNSPNSLILYMEKNNVHTLSQCELFFFFAAAAANEHSKLMQIGGEK